MLISHKYKFIFIHVPKNAGTSIRNALAPHSNTLCKYQRALTVYYLRRVFGTLLPSALATFHVTASEFRRHLGKRWDNYTSFAVCRNPYDRMVSRFHYFKSKPENYEHYRYLETESFRDHVLNMNEETWNDLQSWYLGHNGDVGVTKLLRFECLEQDWNELMDDLGLDGVKLSIENKSSRSADFLSYYDDEMLSRINRIFEDDFNLLGYDMVHKVTTEDQNSL